MKRFRFLRGDVSPKIVRIREGGGIELADTGSVPVEGC